MVVALAAPALYFGSVVLAEYVEIPLVVHNRGALPAAFTVALGGGGTLGEAVSEGGEGGEGEGGDGEGGEGEGPTAGEGAAGEGGAAGATDADLAAAASSVLPAVLPAAAAAAGAGFSV